MPKTEGEMISDEDLDALEELEKKATPGPWLDSSMHCDEKPGVYGLTHFIESDSPEHWGIALVEPCDDRPDQNADLIVAARNALPALIVEVRRLRQRVQNLEDAKVDYRDSVLERDERGE